MEKAWETIYILWLEEVTDRLMAPLYVCFTDNPPPPPPPHTHTLPPPPPSPLVIGMYLPNIYSDWQKPPGLNELRVSFIHNVIIMMLSIDIKTQLLFCLIHRFCVMGLLNLMKTWSWCYTLCLCTLYILKWKLQIFCIAEGQFVFIHLKSALGWD